MAQVTIATDPLVRRRGLTRAQDDVLVAAGTFDGERVELLAGALVEVVPQGPEHGSAVVELTRFLTLRLPEPWRVRPRLPFAATDLSEPEPDLTVTQRFPGVHPSAAVLVIEVSGTTQRHELVPEPGICDAARVEQYWVLDLPRREVVVHTGPGDAGCATVRRLPWTPPLEVLGVTVDLAEVLADL